MTDTRTYADPVEVVADEVAETFKSRVAASAGVSFEDTRVELPNREVWVSYATAALEALKQHGFLSPAYFDAIKARSGK